MSSINGYAQTYAYSYPVPFTQFAQQLAFACPAATNATNTGEVLLATRRNTGFWRNNQTYLAYGAFRIAPNNSPNFHALGASLYYEKEGSFLQRYRGYLQYAYHVSLNTRWRASAGGSLGIMTYQVGNDSYEGGAGNAVDGALSLFFTDKKTYIGATVGQLPENKVQPIQEITLLARYYQLLAGKTFDLNETYAVRTYLNSRWYTDRTPDLQAQAGLAWNQTIGLYGHYHWQRKVALVVGIEKIEIDQMQFRTYFSYDLAINGDARLQAFEVSLQYVLPEKEVKSGKKKKGNSKGKKRKK